MYELTIDGLRFAIGTGTPLRFTKWPPGHEPLCRVVETAWAYSPESFVDGVLGRRGRSFEGNVAYAFAHEHPDQGFEGVSLDYFDDEQVVSERFFRRFIAEYATAAGEARLAARLTSSR